MAIRVLRVSLLCLLATLVHSAKHPVRPPAMFIFGDGQLDIGNSNQLASGDYDVPHDEQQILDPQWVGTDGDNTAQFLAKFMGFKGSPPAYLTLPRPIQVDKRNFTGINYACAGAGLRDPDPNVDGWLTITMSKQLRQFAATRAQMVAKLPAQAVKDLLAKSFFLIEVGDVDLTHSYPYGQTEVHDLLALYGDTIKYLYKMGARKFGLINVGLIGNVASLSGFNVADMNKHAAEFNNGLKTLLGGLAKSKSLTGLRYSIADMYTFTKTVFANPSAYGFKDIRYGCSQDGSTVPPMDNPHQCDNPAQHWYRDDNGRLYHRACG